MERQEGLKHVKYSHRRTSCVSRQIVWVFFCAVRSERQSGQTEQLSELSEVRDRPTFLKNTCIQRDPSEPRNPDHKTTKPPYGCCRVCVWERDDKQGFPSLSDVTWCRSNGAWHWTSQDWNVYLWQEHREKQSCCLRSCSHPHTLTYTHTHTHTHTNTHPPGSIYGDLNLALWRASKGGYLRQMSSEKQGCLKSHPQKECTPAWILHRPTPTGSLRLMYMCTSVTRQDRFNWVRCNTREVIKDDDYVACFTTDWGGLLNMTRFKGVYKS